MTSQNKFIVSIIALIIIIAAFVYALVHFNTETTTQPAPSSGKLDMNVVCNSALSYMSFVDVASSEAFIAECKEGKHPEVIEHYKAQMNLGDGATI